MTIREKTIGEAWLKTAQTIISQGHLMHDGDEAIFERLHITIEVKEPKVADELIYKLCDKEMLQWMADNFAKEKLVSELNNAKSYGWRLRNYGGQSQIAKIIDKLRRKPESKSATITTLLVDDSSYIPCVSLLDFKIRQEKLILTASCRSLDVGKKMGANLIELVRLQEEVAEALSLPLGPLHLWIASGHIYEKDEEYILKVLKEEKIT